jgi:hypothetical protein
MHRLRGGPRQDPFLEVSRVSVGRALSRQTAQAWREEGCPGDEGLLVGRRRPGDDRRPPRKSELVVQLEAVSAVTVNREVKRAGDVLQLAVTRPGHHLVVQRLRPGAHQA